MRLTHAAVGCCGADKSLASHKASRVLPSIVKKHGGTNVAPPSIIAEEDSDGDDAAFPEVIAGSKGSIAPLAFNRATAQAQSLQVLLSQTIPSPGLSFSKWRQTSYLRCVLHPAPKPKGAGCKPRLHAPKAVTYHEPTVMESRIKQISSLFFFFLDFF